MTAYATAKSGYCTCAAAACTSAHDLAHLDTALTAVSILLMSDICILRS